LSDAFLRPLPIVLRTLPRTVREILLVTSATIGADFLEPFDIHFNLMPELTFDAIFFLNRFTETIPVFLREILGTGIRVNAELAEKALARRAADTINRGERNFDALIIGQVDTGDTEHNNSRLALALLVLGILADDVHHSAAANHFAVSADFFDGGADFHSYLRRWTILPLVRS
jgi:hypothetical protein